nr:MAG: capsid protein [Picornaviridae sp.]
MGDVVETPTTTFVDADMNTSTVTNDAVDNTAYKTDVELVNFFKRPVEILTGSWAIDGELDQVFNPWLLWSQNARVANRLNNFYGFTGDLTIKLVINGNPFSWGCLMMSYLPNSSPSFPITQDARNFQPSTFFADYMTASQRQHVLIDPTTSKGGEMVIPLHIREAAVSLTGTAFANWGEIWLRSLNTLRQLNSTKALTFSIYAWCDNARLSGPTQTNMTGLTAQSGELEKGTLSQSLGIVAKAVGSFKKLPAVGDWMTAAEMALKLGSDVAASFGYALPTDEHPVERVKIVAGTPAAAMAGLSTALSLGPSPKNQLTIDNAKVGFPKDEMNFAELTRIPSLLYTAAWAPSATRNTLLANFRVNPLLNFQGTRSLVNAQAVQMTPMGFVASNFRYWRGSLRVRLQIVANSFHRGRLLIVWDPALTPTSPQEHVVRNMIVDIAEARDFEFDVGWGTNAQVLRTATVASDLNAYQVTTSPLATNAEFSNGVVSIFVLNELVTSTTSTTPIQVNIWVSMPDLEVFEPTFEAFQGFSIYPTAPTVALAEPMLPQSGLLETPIYGQTGTESFDLVPKSTDTVVGVSNTDVCVSFRKLVKRYNYVRTYSSSYTSTIVGYFVLETGVAVNPIAYGPGYTVAGLDGTGTNKRNVCPLIPLVFITQGYVFHRGGFRGMISLYPNTTDTFATTISRDLESSFPMTAGYVDLTPDSLRSRLRLEAADSAGSLIKEAGGHRLIEFECPYASNRKYASAATATTATVSYLSAAVKVKTVGFSGPTTLYQTFDFYLAASEDHSLLWFRGTPTLYVYTPP